MKKRIQAPSSKTKRLDGRLFEELRSVRIRKNVQKHALGSCLIEMGGTQVLCCATMEEKVPPFLKGKGRGWLTAEYGMLPGSCGGRIARESSKGRPSGRTQEIQRLIGRSLRSVTDLERLGERTLVIDADVLQGDGGTRTAAITGGWIALHLGIAKLLRAGVLTVSPLRDHLAAVSVGVIAGVPMLDLCYEEDSKAQVDMNVVMTGSGRFVEVQGTAEGVPFSGKQMQQLLGLATKGIRDLVAFQRKAVMR